MENRITETQLSVPEAVLLGHAMVQRVADNLGIRAFFIKGPASVIQGLRLPRTSGDVDVLVHPEEFEAILSALRDRGWRDRPVDPESWAFLKHSVTVYHSEWPCCIDVHFRFPGMEYNPGYSFDVLWANTENLELAGLEVRVSSRTLGILILALHALRSPHLPVCCQELDFLAELTDREKHGAALLELAGSTGSLAAMRPFLMCLLPRTLITVDWPEPTTEWSNRVMAKEPGSTRVLAIIQASLRAKPRMLFRAVFPHPEAFLGRNIYSDMSFRGRLKQHLARWTRFVRAIPNILRDLSQLRKG